MQIFSLVLAFILSLMANFVALREVRMALIPRAEEASTTATQKSATVPLKTISSAATPGGQNLATPPITTTTPVPWGTTEKIGDHLYRTYVGNDAAMGGASEILSALNSYRADHGQGALLSDDKLCALAQKRAQQQDIQNGLDSHKGLNDYMNNPNSWVELNITSIGENASYGYVLSGVHLIEWVFDSDAEHRSNQLNPNWTLGCAGVAGKTVDVIFGKR